MYLTEMDRDEHNQQPIYNGSAQDYISLGKKSKKMRATQGT